MKKKLIYASLTSLLILVLGAGDQKDLKPRSVGTFKSPTGAPVATMININRVAAWYDANGEQERLPTSGNSGLFYPRGTSTAVYCSGLLWGGIFMDSITPSLRVNGYMYNSGTKPGAILGIRTGIAEDPASPDVRIWRIRPDYPTADLRPDSADFAHSGIPNPPTVQELRNQYAKDWAEWPWQKGAPFYDNGYLGPNGIDTLGKGNGVLDWGEDLNHNGVLDPGEDANGNGRLDGETPGLAGADQVIWYVGNDIGVIQPWACPETGIEEQTTIWGYNRADPLGDVVFRRFRLIYKGTPRTTPNPRVQQMYLMQFADVDVGDYRDDYAGCDPGLNISYCYNAGPLDAWYMPYGLKPPASGYILLQGPLVNGVAGQDLNHNGIDDALDVGIKDLRRSAPGFINLPMTSAEYLPPGHCLEYPYSYAAAMGYYQMMTGRPLCPLPPPPADSVINPVTHQNTSFWLDGDPVTRQGWIDGMIDQPGDRRIYYNTGPFSMALGDTQEMVSAWVGGLGSSNILSISVMKFNARYARTVYNNFFQIPKPPPGPAVRATALDGEVILSWDDDSASVARTENDVGIGGFAFEGYNVYQLPSLVSSVRGIRPIATYDLVDGITTIKQATFDTTAGDIISIPVQLGYDNGIRRVVSLRNDLYRGGSLLNGQHYYFAVTAYSYSRQQDLMGNSVVWLESMPQVIEVVPHKPDPGTRYSYAEGDTVRGVTDVVGKSDAIITPVVFNPTLQTGYTYALKFDSVQYARLFFTVTNEQTGKVILRTPTGSWETDEWRIPEGGFSIHVAPPTPGLKSVVDQNGQDLFGENSRNTTFALFSLNSTLQGLAGLGRDANRNYTLVFDGVGAFALRRLGHGSPLGVVRVPFKAFDVGRMPGDSTKQVVPVIGDEDTTIATWNARKIPVVIKGRTYRTFEPVLITATVYPATSDSAILYSLRNSLMGQSYSRTYPGAAIWSVTIANLDSNNVSPPPVGTTILFNKMLEIRTGDVKRIAPVALVSGDLSLARQDIAAIKAFPNPFYGVNYLGVDRGSRFMTFSHLPTHAIIRIYNLAGQHVRTLEKTDPTTQFQRWDLQNTYGRNVANGIYIVHIDMPELGMTKDLKVAVIQEER